MPKKLFDDIYDTTQTFFETSNQSIFKVFFRYAFFYALIAEYVKLSRRKNCFYTLKKNKNNFLSN